MLPGRSLPAVWWRLTLRWRVTLAATVVVAVALALASVLLVLGFRRTLVGALDAGALQRVHDVVRLTEQGQPPNPIPSTGEEAAAVQLLDAQGAVVASSSEIEGNGPMVSVPLPAPLRDGRVVTMRGIAVGDNGSFRVAAQTVSLAGQQFNVVAAVSLSQAERSVATLGARLGLGVPVLVLLVGAVTWLFTGVTLRPVDTLRRQAADISASDLHRRLALPPSRDEIHRLAVTLNDMLARLEASALTQRRFVADAAHELRSPLTALQAQLEVAVAHGGVDFEATGPDLLEDTQRLAHLVEDLLALARNDDPSAIRAQRVVDLDELVLDEVRLQRSRIRVRLRAEQVSAGRVSGDPERLRRVVRNLLDNAGRYAASEVRVSLHAGDGWVDLEVADDGPGIPAGDRERVFERFTRLDAARSRPTGGAGLGLAIVREEVRAHHGTVRIEDATSDASHPGARFVVRLPSAEGSQTAT